MGFKSVTALFLCGWITCSIMEKGSTQMANENLDNLYMNEEKNNCYYHFFDNCNSSRDTVSYLDDFAGTVGYNKSGCISSIVDCSCATYDVIEDSLNIGRCFYNCINRNTTMLDDTVTYTIMPPDLSEWNNIFCGKFNRSGALCGKCQQNLYPHAYSFDMSCFNCTSSSYDWLKYISIAYLPLTCLCIFILSFRLVVPSTLLHGFVLYCQLLSTPTIMRVVLMFTKNQPFTHRTVKIVGSLYGIWNLDFIRAFDLGICLKTGTMTTLSLDLVIAIYPLIFIAFTYIIVTLYDANNKAVTLFWKPFNPIFKCFYKHRNIKASTVDCFATFMLLSSVKLLNVCFDIVLPVEVVQISRQGNISRSWRVYYDASVVYFSGQHLPFVIIVFFVILINIIAPTLLLFLYPFRVCQYILNRFPHRWQLTINTLVDSFQGYYKDRTQASKLDCRPFSAMPFIIRIIVFVIFGVTLNGSLIPLTTIFFALLCMLFILLNPLKPQYYNIHETSIMFILNFALMGVCGSGHTLMYGHNYHYSLIFLVLGAISCSLPLFYIILYIMVSFHSMLMKKLCM